uniref:Poly (ADP-ribose) polymerase family, member 4 n=1 Tax=Stegastes partitus TaxID=144197 RepID=A0A3B4ZYD0_9TELE
MTRVGPSSLLADMAVFENCSVLVVLKNVPFKEKQQLRSAVTENGGQLSFVVNKQCSLVVTNDVSSLSSNRLRSIQKHQISVVSPDYVYSCVTKGVLLPVDGFLLDTSSASSHPPPPLVTPRQDPPPRPGTIHGFDVVRSLCSASKTHLQLQSLLLEEKLNAGSLSQEVGVFVELLWTEALGCLGNILSVPITKLSLNDVSRAEGLLLQAQKNLDKHLDTAVGLLKDFYNLLPQRNRGEDVSAKLISQKLDLCQLIRDVLSVSEMTLRNPSPSCVGKYRALRCSIETRSGTICTLYTSIYLLKRLNVKPLLHSSSPSNFVGILSRGLLLPRAAVEHHGIERTDAGNLGSGIYFSDAVRTCLKYSKPGETDGSRLLLVCDVALGRCKDVYKRDVALTRAPAGHDSVHGCCVCFSYSQHMFPDLTPQAAQRVSYCSFSVFADVGSEVDGVENVANPLDGVKAGLLDSSGQQLPLQAVHVKCKLMDLLSQVIIFQKYTNQSSVPIEAKYVFPLDDSAAVCGFEAFINGKHVVGQVKEKETARKEYRQAVAAGHGAYLMDQDAPDVFTISVGNLPPGATVLIKVTFVSELIVRDGTIQFSLPGSVAPWQEGAALNQTTQVRRVPPAYLPLGFFGNPLMSFTLDMSIEMPYEITSLQCVTHQVKTKRTDCKAVLSVLPGEVMGSDGFQLSIGLSKVHMPRMWVEQHPDKDSQACMLVFYPDFEVGSSSSADEVVLLLDMSESMKGEPLRSARRIALQVLKNLDRDVRVNVILFGTGRFYATYDATLKIQTNTELWRPLRALSLLPPSAGVRNLLLLSDGHIQNSEVSLKLLRDDAQHSRLFTCGLSPTANRHMLRALAQAGGGAYEFFDPKTKHNWAEKVSRQVKRMASPGCSSVSVKWQQFNPTAPPAVQAPKQLHALFNDCHTLVYGFVPHCTQATLFGNLSGQELQTMVSTSELQKTRGTFLHKLTARAVIRDYEDGCLDASEAEHEVKKAELKSFIIELSRDFSILSQFTSFVAIEERDGFTDIPKLIADEDVDFLPYVSWTSPQDDEMLDSERDSDTESDMDMGFALLVDILSSCHFGARVFSVSGTSFICDFVFLDNDFVVSRCTNVRVTPSVSCRSARWEAVKRAVDWVCWGDRQYPCIYSRLEFGLSWESSTRQLLILHISGDILAHSSLQSWRVFQHERPF